MKEVETRWLARVEKRPSLDSIIIDSTNLVGYLVARRGSDFRESQFASSLDLAKLTPFIENVYAERRQQYVASQADRDLLTDTAEWIRGSSQNIEHPATKKMLEMIGDWASKKADVENSSVIYYDPKEKAIAASPVNFGEVEEVELSTLEVLIDGNRPMIEIHTHPDDSLFSVQDYSRMLVDFHNGMRLVKAIMVLCPNIQVLAIATNRTPLLDVDETVELLEGLRKGFDQQFKSMRDRDLFHSLVNTWTLGVARSLNVKLYSSNDMQHFKEFSL